LNLDTALEQQFDVLNQYRKESWIIHLGTNRISVMERKLPMQREENTLKQTFMLFLSPSHLFEEKSWACTMNNAIVMPFNVLQD
jgi:hypothetical protein